MIIKEKMPESTGAVHTHTTHIIEKESLFVNYQFHLKEFIVII